MLKNKLSPGIFIFLAISFYGVMPVVSAAPTAPLAPLKAPSLKEGREYITLSHPVSSQPPVIEFFSFYCGPCYLFVDKYPVSYAINHTLSKVKVTKYHVNLMGALGDELTEAWAIAIVMGKTDQLERPLFEAVQNGNIKDVDDIKSIFSQFGMKPEVYEQMQNNLSVKHMVSIQNKAIKEFEVKSTPSFYVNGKYKVNNSGVSVSSPKAYADNFANVVRELLNQ